MTQKVTCRVQTEGSPSGILVCDDCDHRNTGLTRP